MLQETSTFKRRGQVAAPLLSEEQSDSRNVLDAYLDIISVEARMGLQDARTQ
jgi:hypothetical protein